MVNGIEQVHIIFVTICHHALYFIVNKCHGNYSSILKSFIRPQDQISGAILQKGNENENSFSSRFVEMSVLLYTLRFIHMVWIICWWELICLFHYNAKCISWSGFFSSSDALDSYIFDSSNVSFIYTDITSKELESQADVMLPCVRIHTNMLSKYWHREHISH